MTSDAPSTTPGANCSKRGNRPNARLDTTQRLLDVNRSLAEATHLDSLFARLADAILESTPHERASVLVYDEREQTLTCLASAGTRRFPIGRALPLTQMCAPTRKLIDGHETVLVDYDALPERDCGTAFLAADSHLALEVPLIWQGRLFGLIDVDDSGERREFTQHDIAVIEGTATEAAAAIANARLFEAQHTIAETLQTSLLVMPDKVPGIEFADAYHSASEAARVGGDFYDLFEIDERRVGITIGDVAGKGLDAAMLTSLAKNTIRAHASEPGKVPSRILELTNDLLFTSTPPEAFVTVFFAILDREDGRLEYANAGHTTTAVIRTDGRIDRLESTGPLLGAITGVGFDQCAVGLDECEVLFLYTDGLTEARRGGEQYGEDRLFALLSEAKDSEPSALVERVLADVAAFTGNLLQDDLAILSIRRLEKDPVRRPLF